MKPVKKLLIHMKRGFFLFLFQSLIISLTCLLNQTREWYLSVFFPLLGFANMALAWFLYLGKDGFLHTLKKDYTPDTMGLEPGLSYEGAFLMAGIFLLGTASALYIWAGVGSRFYTPRIFL